MDYLLRCDLLRCDDCEANYTVTWNDADGNIEPSFCPFCGVDLEDDDEDDA